MGNKKTSLKNNIIWNSVGSILYQGVIWLSTVICLAIGGLDDGGALSLAMAVSNVFFTIAIYGMRAYQASDLTAKYSDKEYILSRFFTCAIALLACTVFALSKKDLTVILCLVFYMLFRISEAFMDVLHGIDQRAMRMDIVGKSFILRGIVSLAAFTAVLYFAKSLMLAILVMALSSFVTVLVYDLPYAKSFGDFSKPASTKNIYRLLAETFPLVIYAFLNTVIANLPRVMLENIHGTQALAIFAAIAAPAVVIQLGATYVFTPLISLIANAYEKKDKKAFSKIIMRTNLAIFAIGVAGVVGGFILGDWGLTLLYSARQDVFESVMQNSALLVPVIISAVITAYVLFYNMVLTIIRDFKGLVISNVLGIIACVGGGIILINSLYLQGTNTTVVLALIVQLVSLIIFSKIKCAKHFKTSDTNQSEV